MADKLFMTALSPTMERGTITEWQKKEGDEIKSGDVICEVETDKAVMDYESDFDAVLLKIVVAEGQSAAVGETIAVYGEQGEDFEELLPGDVAAVYEDTPDKTAQAAEDNKPASAAPSAAPPAAAGAGRVKSSPLARKMAKAMGIDLAGVKGSGYDGRIIKRDILKITQQPEQKTAAYTAAVSSVEGQTKGVSIMRKTIAERLTASKFSAPHYYLTLSADMSSLLSSREKHRNAAGDKLSINSYIIKFSAAALMKHPLVNSSWTNEGITSFTSADIGFAVALDDGLIAPVIRNCESLGVQEIDDSFKLLADKARKKELQPADYSNAGFSISNLGGLGIEEFTAIINPPGSAILAIGAIVKTPVVITDENGVDNISIKPLMKMTLSCDHRVIDGAVGAAFLADLKKFIEDPIEALM